MSELEDLINEPLEITTDGKKMLAEFDNNAIKFITKQTGTERYEFYRKFFASELSEEEIEILILAGLLRHQPELCLEDVGKFTGCYEKIIKIISQAYMKIFVQPEVYKLIFLQDEDKEEAEKKTKSLTELIGQEN